MEDVFWTPCGAGEAGMDWERKEEENWPERKDRWICCVHPPCILRCKQTGVYGKQTGGTIKITKQWESVRHRWMGRYEK